MRPPAWFCKPTCRRPRMKGTCRDYNCPASELHAESRLNTDYMVLFYQDANSVTLLEVEIRLPFQDRLCPELVGFLVALRTRGSNTRTLSDVEHPELNCGGVRVQRHDPAERIDLADHLSLRLSADRRVAGHLPNGVKILGEH